MAITAEPDRTPGRRPRGRRRSTHSQPVGRSTRSTANCSTSTRRASTAHRLFVISAGNVRTSTARTSIVATSSRSRTLPKHGTPSAWAPVRTGRRRHAGTFHEGWSPLAPAGTSPRSVAPRRLPGSGLPSPRSCWRAATSPYLRRAPTSMARLVAGPHDGIEPRPAAPHARPTPRARPRPRPRTSQRLSLPSTRVLAGDGARPVRAFRGVDAADADAVRRRRNRRRATARCFVGTASASRPRPRSAQRNQRAHTDRPGHDPSIRAIAAPRDAPPRSSVAEDELADLGEVPVRLRVTLSYFIEPNPTRRGWGRRYRYASHGLRFELKRPTRPMTTSGSASTRRRSTKRRSGRADGEHRTAGTSAARRGTAGRSTATSGTGTAAELAARGRVAVFPVTGWWKELPARDRSDFGARYSLADLDRDTGRQRRHLDSCRARGRAADHDRNVTVGPRRGFDGKWPRRCVRAVSYPRLGHWAGPSCARPAWLAIPSQNVLRTTPNRENISAHRLRRDAAWRLHH